MKKISFSLLFIALFAAISFSCSNVSEGGGSGGGSTWNSPKEVLENLPLASYSELPSRAASARTTGSDSGTGGGIPPKTEGLNLVQYV